MLFRSYEYTQGTYSLGSESEGVRQYPGTELLMCGIWHYIQVDTIRMGKMLGCLAGVAELLPEDKTLTQPVLKQRKTKLLQIHIGYMIFLPLLPVFLGWQESSNRFQKRLRNVSWKIRFLGPRWACWKERVKGKCQRAENQWSQLPFSL